MLNWMSTIGIVETRHISGKDEFGELIAYARLLPPGLRYPEVNLGRFVVSESRSRASRELVIKLIQKANERNSYRCWPQVVL